MLLFTSHIELSVWSSGKGELSSTMDRIFSRGIPMISEPISQYVKEEYVTEDKVPQEYRLYHEAEVK